MNKEELIGKLQMVYVGDKNALNELIGYYDGLKTIISELQQENKQLKDNWNMLKEYCKENTLCYEVGDDENTKLIGSKIHGLNVLDKMQELEQGSDSNGNN